MPNQGQKPAWAGPVLVCRPALSKDTSDVVELSSHIWEGHDYVPEVWAEWLHDPQGWLSVAEYGGRVVGLSKLTLLAPEQWWMEGLRVHPDFQGRGIARQLHNYTVAIWEQQYSGILRLLTSSQRLQVHRLCETTGFSKVAEVAPFEAPALDEGLGDGVFRLLQASETHQALHFILESESFAAGSGLLDLGWHWIEPDEGILAAAVEAQAVYWWRGKRGLLLVEHGQDRDERPILMLRLAAGSLSDYPALLGDARRLAHARGEAWVRLYPALDTQLEAAVKACGLTNTSDHCGFVFAKSAA